MAQISLPAEKTAEMLKEIDTLGKAAIKSDGRTMTFDYFLESSKIIEKYVSEFLVSIRHDHDEKRRKCTADSLVDGEIAKDLGRDDCIREHYAM